MYRIYYHNYADEDEGEFETVEAAVQHALTHLPTDDIPYMIGDDSGIEAFVFQGEVYRLSAWDRVREANRQATLDAGYPDPEESLRVMLEEEE